MNTTTPVYLANLRGSRPVTLITVLEGNGEYPRPYMEVHYVIDDDGKVFGRVERNWQETNALFNDACSPTPGG